ncbi:unnamed protein product [Dovyalis caffra]|uniref:Uncharacterized protein n=1 Tax=Dovyalis caffra TaxID=77055 RepID=A0AAV1SLL9_9ROSI|nr:unnamed protein product [Dovyalis caffra]
MDTMLICPKVGKMDELDTKDKLHNDCDDVMKSYPSLSGNIVLGTLLYAISMLQTMVATNSGCQTLQVICLA